MARKTNNLELIKWSGWMTASAIGLGYAMVWTLDSAGFDMPDGAYSLAPSLLTTLGMYHLYTRQLKMLDNHLPEKPKKNLIASNSRAIPVNGNKQIFMSAVSSIFGNESPSAADDKLVWWQYGPYTIYEDLAYEWMRKGWNRQLKLDAHPFSGNWMTEQRFYSLNGQRIERGVHNALVNLIADFQLWLKEPRQGVAGKLRASPAGSLGRLKGKW